MRYSNLLGRVQSKTNEQRYPLGCEILIKAGYLQVVDKGLFVFLPLGELVFRKLRSALEKKLENIGGQAISWPDLSESRRHMQMPLEGAEPFDKVAIEFLRLQVRTPKELPLFVHQCRRQPSRRMSRNSQYQNSEVYLQKCFTLQPSFASMNNFLPRVHYAYKSIFDACGLETLLIRDSGREINPNKRYKSSAFVLQTEHYGNCRFCSCQNCNYRHFVNQHSNLLELERGSVKRGFSRCRICREKLTINKGYILSSTRNMTDFWSTPLHGVELKESLAAAFLIKIEFHLTQTIFFTVERNIQEQGFLWPKWLSPYEAVVMGVGRSATVQRFAENLMENHASLLLDDRHISASRKLQDFYQLGISKAVIISAQKLQQGRVDVINRYGQGAFSLPKEKINDFLAEKL